jgi:hypothetical protein
VTTHAIVCNATLVQRGAPDVMRGRALTLVMSATYAVMGIGTVVAGALLTQGNARWLWIAAGIACGLAAVVGYALARGSAEADVGSMPPPEPAPYEVAAH